MRKICFASLALLVSFVLFPSSARAQLSQAICELSVNVNNTTGHVTMEGTVRENSPGLDPSYTYGVIFDSDNRRSVDDSGTEVATVSYPSTYFPNGNYTATVQGYSFSNPGGGSSSCIKQQTFVVSVSGPPPSQAPNVDIKANGSDGPITISYNNSATITWTSNNATSCSVSPTGWSGTSGTQVTGALTSPVTYTLSCSGPGGTSQDSVYVNVGSPAPPPPPGAPGPFFLSGSCTIEDQYNNRANLSWTPSSGAGWYNIYRRAWSTGIWEFQDTDAGSPHSQVVRNDTDFYYRVVAGNSNGTITATPDTLLVCNALEEPPGGGEPPPPPPPPVGCTGNCAIYISQNVPSSVEINKTFPVTITMRNVGTTTWTCCSGSDGHKLGTQNPQDNFIWGLARVAVPSAIAPGAYATFNFTATAPSVAGTYNFQMRMVQEFFQWFGEYTPNVAINVVNPPANNLPVGWHDGNFGTVTSDQCIARGWAYDPDGGNPINVHIYVGGTWQTGAGPYTATANQPRPDVQAAFPTYPSNTGYSFPLPVTFHDNVARAVYVYGLDAQVPHQNPLLLGSPKTITCLPQMYTLTASVNGSGSVGSMDSLISCPGDCSEAYTNGTSVTLIATPSSGHQFTGWSGTACSGSNPSCTTVMNANKTATANFSLATAFNYSLTNLSGGTVTVTKTSAPEYGVQIIRRNLLAGTPEPVTISVSIAGNPAGISYSIANPSCTPSPNCDSNILFTVSPSAQAGTYTVTVTGQPLGRTTSFNLVVTGSPIAVSCTPNPTTALVGQNVTWTANVTGGSGDYTYAWSGTNFPTSPAPSTNPYSIVYTTTGLKTASTTVTDTVNTTQATCPASTVRVNFDPRFEEF